MCWSLNRTMSGNFFVTSFFVNGVHICSLLESHFVNKVKHPSWSLFHFANLCRKDPDEVVEPVEHLQSQYIQVSILECKLSKTPSESINTQTGQNTCFMIMVEDCIMCIACYKYCGGVGMVNIPMDG